MNSIKKIFIIGCTIVIFSSLYFVLNARTEVVCLPQYEDYPNCYNYQVQGECCVATKGYDLPNCIQYCL